jgi:hypothetical protein
VTPAGPAVTSGGPELAGLVPLAAHERDAIGRIGNDGVDRGLAQLGKDLDAVAVVERHGVVDVVRRGHDLASILLAVSWQ